MTPADLLPVLALHHLGSLHPYETALVLLIAFGPFVVIVGLVVLERRRAAAPGVLEDPDALAATEAPAEQAPDGARPA